MSKTKDMVIDKMNREVIELNKKNKNNGRLFSYAEWKTGKSDRMKCSVCMNKMPSYIQRFEFGYKDRFGKKGILPAKLKICERCWKGLAKRCSKSRIKKWEGRLLMEKL